MSSTARAALPYPEEAADAERICVGALMMSREGIRQVFARTVPGDFYDPRLRAVAGVVLDLDRAGKVAPGAADPGAIMEALGPGECSRLGMNRAWLLDLLADCPGTHASGQYAQRVATWAERRRLYLVADDLAAAAFDPSMSVDEAIADLHGRLRTVHQRPDPLTATANYVTGWDQEPPPVPWCIHGLLETGERAVIVGGEGGGKSTLTRQIGLCAALGVEPFTAERGRRPIDVMLIDFENSPEQMVRSLHSIQGRVARAAAAYSDGAQPAWDRVTVLAQKRPINIIEAADQAWLTGVVAAAQPELLILGPLYRMFRPDPADRSAGSEESVLTAQYFLDELRDLLGLTLIIEAHAPKGGRTEGWSVRGSAAWLGWPDYGMAIAGPVRGKDLPEGVYDLARMRGARGEGRWPIQLRRGGRLPWSTYGPEDGPEPPPIQDELA